MITLVREEEDGSVAENNKTVYGYFQPCLTFCPSGHVMLLIEGKGSLEHMKVFCPNKECEHYQIEYKVSMPQLALKLIETLEEKQGTKDE
jgi:hypothetical protein